MIDEKKIFIKENIGLKIGEIERLKVQGDKKENFKTKLIEFRRRKEINLKILISGGSILFSMISGVSKITKKGINLWGVLSLR